MLECDIEKVFEQNKKIEPNGLTQNDKDALKETIAGMNIEELDYIVRLIDPLILVNALTEYICNMQTLQNSLYNTYETMKKIPSNTIG